LLSATTEMENDFVPVSCQLLLPLDPTMFLPNVDGAVGVLTATGASGPIASFVGDGVTGSELYFDLSTLFSETSHVNLAMSDIREFEVVLYGPSSVPEQTESFDVSYSNLTEMAMTTVYTVWSTQPVIAITNGDQMVDYSIQSYTLSGTNNAYVVGTMLWSNRLTVLGGTVSAAGSWTIPGIGLEVGRNLIVVAGTDQYGQGTDDLITITRDTRLPNEVAWWYQRNVLVSEGSESDYIAANAGQLKWVATQAFQEFEAKLPGGAGTGIVALVNGFGNTDNYDLINQGQLKTVVKPFYDRLWELGLTNAYPVGVTNQYPWTTNAPSDYNAANVGHLKYLFSFELE